MFISTENAQKIAQELKSVTGHDINVIDKTGEIAASTDRHRIGQIHEGARRLVQEGLRALTVNDDDSAGGVRQGINLPIVIDGAVEGVIGITGRPQEVEVFGNIIKKMTEIMASDIRRKEEAAASDSARDLFAENWLNTDGGDPAELERRSAPLGIDVACPRVVAVIDCGDYYARMDADEFLLVRIAAFVRRKLGADRQNLCLSLRGEICLILRERSADRACAAVAEILSGISSFFRIKPRCGISAAAENGLGLKLSLEQARSACRIAAQMPGRQIARYTDCSAEFVIGCIPDAVRRNISRQIFASCKAEEQEQLCETLRLYFRHGGDIDAASRAAYVHKNTFYYRIGRLEKLTGYSLRKPDEQFLLYIAACSQDEPVPD